MHGARASGAGGCRDDPNADCPENRNASCPLQVQSAALLLRHFPPNNKYRMNSTRNTNKNYYLGDVGILRNPK